jgi:hypothetical protein
MVSEKVIKYADLETPLKDAGIEYIIANNGGSTHFYFVTPKDKLKAYGISCGGIEKSFQES